MDQSGCEVDFRPQIRTFRAECQPAGLSAFQILLSCPQPSLNFPQIRHPSRKGDEVKLAVINQLYQIFPEAYARRSPLRGGFIRYRARHRKGTSLDFEELCRRRSRSKFHLRGTNIRKQKISRARPRRVRSVRE